MVPQTSEEETTNGIQQAASRAQHDLELAWEGLKEGDFGRALPLITEYLWPAVQVLLLLIVGYMIAKLIARLVSKPVKARVDETLGRFVQQLVYYAIMISLLVAVLGRFGFHVTSFAAILASAGFAIGMAFQGTLGSFASGIMLLVFRPFKIGDVISAAGVTAKVNAIDLFNTTFDTPDNRRFIVPNSAITSGTIENISHHDERRVDVSVGCSYDADLKQTRDVLTKAAEAVGQKTIQGEGRGFQVVLGDLGDSSVGWTVRVWTSADDFWAVKEELTEHVKNHLDATGIGIPYPTMDVNVSNAA